MFLLSIDAFTVAHVATHTYSASFLYIGFSEMFLSFYKEIIDAQFFLFYISSLNYA